MTADPSSTDLSTEIAALRSELAFRDQLVEHLTRELQQQSVERPEPDSPAFSATPRSLSEQLRQLADRVEGREQQFAALLQQLEQQLEQSRRQAEQLGHRLEQETQLRQDQVADLTRQREEISAALQQQISGLSQRLEELPNLYHRKFTERLEPVLGQIRQLNQENSLLQEKLQTISFVVSNSSRPQGPVDLPSFTARHGGQDSLAG
jgi:chromosome segregation ATPase